MRYQQTKQFNINEETPHSLAKLFERGAALDLFYGTKKQIASEVKGFSFDQKIKMKRGLVLFRENLFIRKQDMTQIEYVSDVKSTKEKMIEETLENINYSLKKLSSKT